MRSLCSCGCGKPVPVGHYRPASRGLQRFINGHNMRQRAVNSTHHYKVNGHTRAHVLRAEQALGKPLPAGAEVHHVDGSKNPSSPLVICQDVAYHRLLHVRTRVLRAGGNPNTQFICAACKLPKDFSEFYPNRRGSPNGWRSRWNSKCKECVKANFAQWRKANHERISL